MRKLPPGVLAEHRREQWRKRKEKDPAKELEKNRKYRANNREKLNARRRAWYQRHRERELEAAKEYRARNKELIAEYARRYNAKPEKKALTLRNKRKRWYGLTDEQITMVDNTHTCQCCGGAFTEAAHKHVDHSHKTGVFRGVLCRGCNHAAGNLKDDPDRAAMLYVYLRKVGP